jgi:ribose-phosphate pyrophosphokinase
MPPAGRDVVLVCSLNDPDAKTLALLFAAQTAKELGAMRIGLVAPYLAYMRQDARFRAGEAISANLYAALLSREFAWMVTVDPHLHRHAALEEIFRVPTRIVHAAPLLAEWIRGNCPNALVLGPDEESEQWVSAVAAAAGSPHATLTKRRLGDRQVEVVLPDLTRHRGRTPVLVDDIVSSGETMAAAARALRAAGFVAPLCLAVHALFATGSVQALQAVGVTQLATTDTVEHPSNRIALAEPLALAAWAALEAVRAAQSARSGA